MGNIVTSSCKSCSIRVIGSNGRVQELARPVTASELVARHPGQFVCDADRLRVGCRVPGLAAGEELESSHVYFLLPMDLLYSVLTEEEMDALACRAAARKSVGRRIFPVLSDFCLIPSEAKKVAEEAERWRVVAAAAEDVDVSRQWSWRPALETIEESP